MRDERFYQHSYSLPFQRLLWEQAYKSSTALQPQARRDPIFTPLFTAIGFTGSITIGAATISTASIASAIATTALTVGLQMLMAPRPPKPEDGRAPLTQSIPYRQWIVGRTRVAGARMLWEAKGSRLFSVQAIAGHRIKSVNRYYLHDDTIELSDLDENGQLTFDGERYGNNVWLFHRLGEAGQTAYADIVDKLGAEGVWTSNHIGVGQASIAMMAENPTAQNQNRRFPHGPPNASVEADGAYVLDYRIDSDPDNPAAWVWSRNAALIMAWHQCFSEFGHRRSYERAILPVLDMWIEEANICDENVALAGGGTEKRYECNGFDTTENGPKVGTNAILASCDGWICERGDGALLFTVGKFRESRCGVITDSHLLGHAIQYDVLPEEECNRLIPKFTYPATEYSTTDTDYFEDTAAQLSAGRILAQEAEYQWVHQWRQCRRLAKREWLRLQQKARGSLDLRLSGINAVYNRWNRLQTPLRIPSLNGAIVENRRSLLNLTKGGFSTEFIRHPENIDAWNPVTDEGAQPPVPVGPDPDIVPAPVVNLVQVKSKSGTAFLRIVIVDPSDKSLTPVVRYRTKAVGATPAGAWLEQKFPDAEPGVPTVGYIELATKPVPTDQGLELQVAFEPSDGEYGAWCPTVDVTAYADDVAPLSLQSFVKTNSAPNLGYAAFSVTTRNDSHVRTVSLYRVASGAAFDPAAETPIAVLAVSPSATFAVEDGDGTRTNLATNGTFASDTAWNKGTGWSIAGGVAAKVASASASFLSQTVAFTSGQVIRTAYTVTGYSAGTVLARISGGGTQNDGFARSANGTYLQALTLTADRDTFAFRGDASFGGSIDNVVFFVDTPSCAPQGAWDYYAVPFNGSALPGSVSGPVAVTIT